MPCWLHNLRYHWSGPISSQSIAATGTAIGSCSLSALPRPSWTCSAFSLRGGRG
jgi:hypothetical protein